MNYCAVCAATRSRVRLLRTNLGNVEMWGADRYAKSRQHPQLKRKTLPSKHRPLQDQLINAIELGAACSLNEQADR
jgi:hypothetical protein